jgi:hypothetical protein
MPETLPQTKPRQKPSRLPPLAPIAVPRKMAWQMLGIGETKLDELVRNGELESYLEGTARRILTASIHSYVARKVAASKTDRS